MKKIPSVFLRNHDGDHQVRDEVTPGCEWVFLGEGVPTIKFDGTAVLWKDKKLYKRYDRKGKRGKIKEAPEGWIPCEDTPDEHTGHWPGWVPVGDGPEDQWHREAYWMQRGERTEGTYELIGTKINGNPYGRGSDDEPYHAFYRHGDEICRGLRHWIEPPTFEFLKFFLENSWMEGVVWHHQDKERMAKIKRRDFGLEWPTPYTGQGTKP